MIQLIHEECKIVKPTDAETGMMTASGRAGERRGMKRCRSMEIKFKLSKRS